jgi:hypothetical protein
VTPSWSVFPSRIRARSETWSLAQDGVSAMSPCSGQRIAGSRAVTNASNAITSGWRQVPSVNSTAWQARPQCGHGNREPARKPKRSSSRRRAKSKSLLTTRHGGWSCNASSKSCFMLRTGTPSVNDRTCDPPDSASPGADHTLARTTGRDNPHSVAAVGGIRVGRDAEWRRRRACSPTPARLMQRRSDRARDGRRRDARAVERVRCAFKHGY